MPPQTSAKRAIVYARQSKDSEDGIDRQIEKCLKLVADRGWELVHAPYCDNDVSATKRRKRPQYEAAMAMVKNRQCDVLVVAHMDRLYRRAAELETIIPVVEQTGVLVVSTDGAYDLSTANGRMVARMLCAASQGEVETRVRRGKDAHIQAARNGVRNKSGCRPFGYADNRVDPLEPEAQAVRDAIDSVLRGGSITGITRKWGAEGLRPPLAPYGPLPDGNPWTHHTVKRILTNPHIAGLRAYNGEIVAAGDWVPLVTVEKWEAAQAVLVNPARVPSRGALSLLGGIALCQCGSHVKHARRVKHDRPYGTYRCSAYEKEGPAREGPHVALKAEPIDRYVTDVLITTLERPDAADLFAPDKDEVDIPALKERLAILDTALTKLSMQNSMGLIPDSVFMTNASQISAERETVTARIAEAGQVNAAAVLLAAPDVRQAWEDMNISERRAVIRSVTSRIRLVSQGCGCRRPDMDKLVRIAWRA